VTAPAELAILRGLAEEAMRSTCTITRPGTGTKTWDETTGRYTFTDDDVVYEGPCKVQDNGRSITDAEAGDSEVGVNSASLHLPIDAAGSGAVRRDDLAVITGNPEDPALVGRRFIAQAGHSATAKTARRIPVEEVV
jgi:hypothetical protein